MNEEDSIDLFLEGLYQEDELIKKESKKLKFLGKNVLFHYTRIERAMENILPTNRIRLSSFRAVNDPRERKERNIKLEYNTGEYRISHDDIIKYKKAMNAVCLDKLKILCFSKNQDDVLNSIEKTNDTGKYFSTGFFKPRMWAQYGDNHKGICLAFDKTILAEELKKNKHIKKFYRGDVKYTDSTHELSKSLHFEMCEDLVLDFEKYFIERHIIKYRDPLFFTKSLDWRDEQEYRFMALVDNPNDNLEIDISNALVGVFLGIDFPVVYMESLKVILDKRVDIKKLNLVDGRPSVEDINR